MKLNLGIVVFSLFAALSFGQDPAKVSPEVYKILLENDDVRVLAMTLEKGAEDKKHSHPIETVYFISGGKGKITLPDGKSMEMEIPDGHVMHHEGWTHQVKNVGEKKIHAILVEHKRLKPMEKKEGAKQEEAKSGENAELGEAQKGEAMKEAPKAEAMKEAPKTEETKKVIKK